MLWFQLPKCEYLMFSSTVMVLIIFFQFTMLVNQFIRTDVHNTLCWTWIITTQQHNSWLEHFLFHSVASNSPAKGLLPWNYSCLDLFSMFTSKNSSHLNQYTPRSSAGSHWTVRFHVFFTKNLRNHWNVNYSVGKRKRAFFFSNALKCSAGCEQK